LAELLTSRPLLRNVPSEIAEEAFVCFVNVGVEEVRGEFWNDGQDWDGGEYGRARHITIDKDVLCFRCISVPLPVVRMPPGFDYELQICYDIRGYSLFR
jgi:hypothetical protein